jgi:hypothetical protein
MKVMLFLSIIAHIIYIYDADATVKGMGDK